MCGPTEERAECRICGSVRSRNVTSDAVNKRREQPNVRVGPTRGGGGRRRMFGSVSVVLSDGEGEVGLGVY